MNGFHLLRPEWLLALVPLGLLLWLQHHQRPTAGSWDRVCDSALLPFLLAGKNATSRWRISLALGTGGVLAILALAGPAWKQLEQPLFKQRSSLVILLDLSRSMDAEDLRPSRLVRAKYKLLDLLARRSEGETALIVYAAQPFVVTPLTEDTETIAALVNSLDSSILPSQGSRPDLALARGLELLSAAGASGDLLFITDEIDATLITEGLASRPTGIAVSVLAVGTPEGAPIPLPDGGFLKDQAGEIVISAVDTNELSSLAFAGGGEFIQLTADDRDIEQLLKIVSPAVGDEYWEQAVARSDQWREEGPWLLLPLLVLAAIVFRRGYLLLVLITLLPMPQPLYALDWDRIWQRPDQIGADFLASGNPAAAADIFEDPLWRSAAHYRAGDYEQSLASLESMEGELADYNRGNVLARLGRLQEALQAYDRVLEQNPHHADAEYNRDLIQQQMQPRQPPSGENGNNQDQQPPSGENGEHQDQQRGEPNEEDGQSSGGRKQDERLTLNKPQSENTRADSTAPGKEELEQQPAHEKQSEKQPREQSQPPERTTENTASRHGDSEESATPQQEEQILSENEPEQDQDSTDEISRQWLRKIPDDPGGLLRRKFRYQYQRQYQGRPEHKPW